MHLMYRLWKYHHHMDCKTHKRWLYVMWMPGGDCRYLTKIINYWCTKYIKTFITFCILDFKSFINVIVNMLNVHICWSRNNIAIICNFIYYFKCFISRNLFSIASNSIKIAKIENINHIKHAHTSKIVSNLPTIMLNLKITMVFFIIMINRSHFPMGQSIHRDFSAYIKWSIK